MVGSAKADRQKDGRGGAGDEPERWRQKKTEKRCTAESVDKKEVKSGHRACNKHTKMHTETDEMTYCRYAFLQKAVKLSGETILPAKCHIHYYQTAQRYLGNLQQGRRL